MRVTTTKCLQSEWRFLPKGMKIDFLAIMQVKRDKIRSLFKTKVKVWKQHRTCYKAQGKKKVIR